jgi:hypothetical protein
VSPPPYDLRSTAQCLFSAWRQFFYSPVDPRICASIRIGYALLVLINLACWYPDLTRWFTDAGVLPTSVAHQLQPPERWSLLFWLPEGAVPVAFWIFTAQTVLLLLGVASRVNSACVLLWLTSFQHRNPLIWDSEDTLLRLLGWYVLFMPVDRAWTIGRPDCSSKPVSAWGLRLLQIQMSVILLTAAFYKLSGEPWRDGTALFFVSRLDDYFGRLPQLNWVFETPWLVRLLTWSVIAIEIVVALGVWFRQTRRWALMLALLFHLGNELTMHLYLFHWTMLVGWIAFLLPEDFRIFAKIPERSKKEVTG